MIRRRPHEEEHENHERWLVSYADFITLLFAFFVVMYAISSVNQGKYNQLTSSLGSAFSGDISPRIGQQVNGSEGSTRKNTHRASIIQPINLSQLRSEKMIKERESMAAMAMKLSNSLSPLISQGKIRMVQNNRGIRIDIHDSLLFSPGSATLSPAASGPLGEIAESLKTNSNLIQIEGHTDNQPIHNDQFFSNWELSALRATSLVRSFSASGLDESRLSAAGFGSAQPISDNSTLEGRAKNRRVSIMILYSNAAQDSAENSEITPDKR
ncbi:flagellar motor protein MotD [Methylovorus sp. MM2]|uniref:flagellar motor protein MotD n=1 Tax=Methylovorus sp. MM2 TaxID=1848038 RepID=UPI000AA1AE71|nr:flagellar motor protein MotD [Methylovorus sp. MM2]